MARIGQFVKAPVAFKEADGRSKVRPVLILAKAKMKDGSVVYLTAPASTQAHKTRGDVEVILRKDEAIKVGLSEESVLRFSRQSLVAVLDRDVTNLFGHYTALSGATQRAIGNAAKSVGCEL